MEVGSRSNSQLNSGREIQYIAQSGKGSGWGRIGIFTSYLRTKAWLELGTDCCCSVAK